MRDRRRSRLSVALALSLGLVAAVFAVPASAATGDPEAVSRGSKQSLFIWAYFDGDTPVTGARVRVYAGGRRLRERGDGPGPVRTFPGGNALLRFASLPSKLRIVVSGGRAGGRAVRGSLKAKLRGVANGDLVHINPVTTVADVWAHADEGRSHRRARNVVERTLGIRRILDDHDLYATDQWFNGDRFHRWALKQGSVGAGARALVQHIERPGFDRRVFRPRDGEGPDARVAASGGAGDFIGGLLDAINGAAGLTGPQGFLLSAATLFFKQFIDIGLDGGGAGGDEDAVSAKLNALSTQISQLKSHIDTKLLQKQIDSTKNLVIHIGEAQEKFKTMVMFARDAENKKLSPKERQEASDSIPNSTTNFMRAARDKLVDADARVELHKALTNKQRGTPQNPLGGPALLPAVREEIGKERFFTKESSQKIRGFFEYYEWAQNQLATVLTEYYLLGGGCLLPDTKLTGCANPPKPDRGNARLEVTKIKNNIAEQREYLPPKYLDSEPFNSQVFIDTTTNIMWATRTEYFDYPGVASYGAFSGCRQDSDEKHYDFCGLDISRRIAGYSSWSAPTYDQATKLFENHPGNALDWLKTLGVSFDNAPPRKRFQVALWLRDGWHFDLREQPDRSVTATLLATQLALQPTGGAPYKNPERVIPAPVVARKCRTNRVGSWPYVSYRIDYVPSCGETEPTTGGSVLWIHGAPERKDYLGADPAK